MKSFEHPSSGKTHLLKSDKRQMTVRYPVSDEFYARPYCGSPSVTLRHGDLDQLPVPEADLDDDTDWCERCVEAAPILVTDDSDSANHASARLELNAALGDF